MEASKPLNQAVKESPGRTTEISSAPISLLNWGLRDEKDFLKILASIIFIVGTPAFFTLFQRSSESSSFSQAVSSARDPASVSSSVASSPGASLVNLDCGQRLQNTSTESSHLRLAGTLCDPKSGTYQIRNETNGYTATVIQTPDAHFTTDFIELSPGINVISVKDVGSLQARQLHIHRRSASQ
ncbi:MAG: hypothetical protein WCH11_04345 [Bdellovibrio sp.]